MTRKTVMRIRHTTEIEFRGSRMPSLVVPGGSKLPGLHRIHEIRMATMRALQRRAEWRE